MTTTDTTRPDSRSGSLTEVLDAIAGHLGTLVRQKATGQIANLRRLDVSAPVDPAFHALIAKHVPDHLFRTRGAAADEPGGEMDMVRRFATVVQIMADRPDALSPKGMGSILGEVGLSEQRLAMLLSARGATFAALARRTAKRVVTAGSPLPYRDFGRLLLLDSRPDHEREAEATRIRVARDFQRSSAH
ncbi:type I-E CRISPR-associated protein Cse2/CasB [Bosea sp. RAC05]|uniref:type I-E CRISPR-associated protein Cse2/CasB n=1 Tax=Bosea sp. RAC05 TaxID=1842539 RepID=UPI0008552527|nr:hypothetical protein [Bosea sp. RAC05]AOG02916.1 hypothetical protein BSY19_4794 [Bosea sp. RAC05]